MNQSLNHYFALARSQESKHQNILRDLKYFLKSVGVSDAVIALEDQYELSFEAILKINNFFSSYLAGIPLDYILNESEFMGYKFYVETDHPDTPLRLLLVYELI